MPIYAWKGLKDSQYATGRIEGINREEAAFKVKEQKVIITSLVRLSGAEVVEEKPADPPPTTKTAWEKGACKRACHFHQKVRSNDAGRTTDS